jgi:hypothetical protein
MATTPVATDSKTQNSVFISAENLGDRVGMQGAGNPQAGPNFVEPLFKWMAILGFGKNEDPKAAAESKVEGKKEKEEDDDDSDVKEVSKKAAVGANAPTPSASTLGLSLGADKAARKIEGGIKRNQESVRRNEQASQELAAKTDTVYLPPVQHYGTTVESNKSQEFGSNFGKVDTKRKLHFTEG